MRRRFHAWWEGYDLVYAGSSGGNADDLTAFDEEDEDEGAQEVDWPTERIPMLQEIWGEGFVRPGEAEFWRTHIESFALSSALSVLEIGAGIGGLARELATSTGAYISAYELDPVLAREGAEKSRRKGLEGRASIELLEPEMTGLRKSYYQGALIHDTLYRVPDRAGLLKSIATAVRGGGEVVILDIVAGEDGKLVSPWPLAEEGHIDPPAPETLAEELAAARLDIRIDQDYTDAYRNVVLAALGQLAARLDELRPPNAKLGPTLDEVERWARFMDALQKREIRYRWMTAIRR